jgi:Holliday junction resolvase RusA-like endonuclease
MVTAAGPSFGFRSSPTRKLYKTVHIKKAKDVQVIPMTHTLTIPGTLPGLNEYIAAERGGGGKYRAAAMKRDAEQLVGLCARSQLRGVQFSAPVTMHYTWYEPNRRRDKDNISFARKFIQDALVKAGILPGDGWACIEGFSDAFAVDPSNPRICVTITNKTETETNQ